MPPSPRNTSSINALIRGVVVLLVPALASAGSPPGDPQEDAARLERLSAALFDLGAAVAARRRSSAGLWSWMWWRCTAVAAVSTGWATASAERLTLLLHILGFCCGLLYVTHAGVDSSPLYLRSISTLSPLYLHSVSATSAHLRSPPLISVH